MLLAILVTQFAIVALLLAPVFGRALEKRRMARMPIVAPCVCGHGKACHERLPGVWHWGRRCAAIPSPHPPCACGGYEERVLPAEPRTAMTPESVFATLFGGER